MNDTGRPAPPRLTHCPLLALEGEHRGRCRASGRPERIALAYQQQVCQAAAFLHCPRLAEAAAQALARAGRAGGPQPPGAVSPSLAGSSAQRPLPGDTAPDTRPPAGAPSAAAPAADPPRPPAAHPSATPGARSAAAPAADPPRPPATHPMATRDGQASAPSAAAPTAGRARWPFRSTHSASSARAAILPSSPGEQPPAAAPLPAGRTERTRPDRTGREPGNEAPGLSGVRDTRGSRAAAGAGSASWVAGQPAPAAGRRPITRTEMALMALSISILFAALSAVLALAYRAQVGPGMHAVPAAVAGGPEQQPTPRPTFTPTAAVTAGPPAGVVANDPSPTAARPDTPLPAPVLAPARPPAGSPPTRLRIDKIELDLPVLVVGTKAVRSGSTTRTVWADVPNAAGFHQTSAYPGWPGNTVINGHRDIMGAVFRQLDRLAPGDEIVLYVGEVAYPYQVVETRVVPETFASAAQRAENLRLIGYLPEERLTLVTCTPPGLATHRLLVIARPPGAADMPEAGSTAAP